MTKSIRIALPTIALCSSLSLGACNDDNSSPSTAVTPSPTPGLIASTPTPAPTVTPAPAPTAPPAEVEKGQVNLLLSPSVATISSSAGTGCVMCGVTNLEGALDPDPDNFATANLDVALLNALGSQVDMGAEITISVSLAGPVNPAVPLAVEPGNPASARIEPNQPGFVISFPDISTLSLSLAPAVEVSALSGGEVVAGPESYGFGFFDALVLATPLQDINNAQVFLGVPADASYDEIRMTLSGALVDVFLPVNVHQSVLQGFTGSISGDF